jgi:hypothetical protein
LPVSVDVALSEVCEFFEVTVGFTVDPWEQENASTERAKTREKVMNFLHSTHILEL